MIKSKRLILMIVVFFCVMFIRIDFVKAAVQTDFSDVELSITGITDSDNSTPIITISGVTFNSEYVYWAYISHSSTDAPASCMSSCNATNMGLEKSVSKSTSSISSIYKYFEEAGDIYVTLYENVSSTIEKATPTIKVRRPNCLALSKRLIFSPHEDETMVISWEVTMSNVRSVNYKIGLIPDDRLANLRNNVNETTLGSLLTYANNDASSNKTGSIQITSHLGQEIISDFDLVEDNYYYIYVSLDDEAGKYYPVEDISVYKALKGSDENLSLVDYLNDDFTWGDDVDTTAEENPKTGLNIYTDIVIIGILASAGIYLSTRKTKHSY